MLSIHLALDQGGTKTDAVVFTGEGAVLARGDDRAVRGPADDYAAQQAQFIRLAAERALARAQVTPDGLESVCAAVNGADWPHEYPRLRRMISDTLGVPDKRITVVNDCIGAMRGGTDAKRCGVLCVGSGLNCAVRNGRGGEIIYGYFIADTEQGGGALGKAAWWAAVDAHNGLGPPTALTDALLSQYGREDLQSLFIAFTDRAIPMVLKDMAPTLMRVARQGDAVALRIVDAMAARLAQYVHQAMRRLVISGDTLALVVSGGVTKGAGHVLTASIKRHVKALEPQVTCVSAPYEPVAGTALVALDALYPAGIPRAVMARFEGTARAHHLLRAIEGKENTR